MAVMKRIAIAADLYTQKPNTATSLTGASSHTGEEWSDINWRKAHQNVRRLQARIVSDACIGGNSGRQMGQGESSATSVNPLV